MKRNEIVMDDEFDNINVEEYQYKAELARYVAETGASIVKKGLEEYSKAEIEMSKNAAITQQHAMQTETEAFKNEIEALSNNSDTTPEDMIRAYEIYGINSANKMKEAKQESGIGALLGRLFGRK